MARLHWCLFLGLLISGSPAWAGAPPPPNVVIFFADDLGHGDLGCYGSTRIATPNLDGLASTGRRFMSFHSAQPVCSASRASLLTGCYSNRLGIHGALGPNSLNGIQDSETTLAELLRSKGYATAAVGKWHLGHHARFLPLRHGFDEFLGLPYSNDMWPLHPEAKPGTYPPLPLIDGELVVNPEVTPEAQAELTSRYTEQAVRFIERQGPKPFFLYVAYSMPHVPLFTAASRKGRSSAGLYGDVVEEIDDSVGTIIAAIQRIGAEDRTLVMFSSDNGPWLSYGSHAGSSGRLREGKGTVWEGGTRVPCILKWPGRVPAGTTSDARWCAIDVLPTIAALVGAELPGLPIDGLDVWPWIMGQDGATNPHEAYFHYYEENQLQAVTSGDGHWKLILPHKYRTLGGRPGGSGGVPVQYESRTIEKPELYDLLDDPGEWRNVAAGNEKILERLLAFAEKARADLGDSLTQRQGKGVRAAGRVEPAPARPKGE